MLDKIRALLLRSDAQSKASVLDSAIAQLDLEIVKDKAALAAAEAERPSALRSSDHIAAENRQRIDGLKDKVLLAEDARTKLVIKRDADLTAEPARKAAYRKAKAASEAASADIRRRYPELSAELLGLLRKLELARMGVEAVNADLPAGAAPLDLPEDFRDHPQEAEKIENTQTNVRWVARPEYGGHAVDPEKTKGFADRGNGTASYLARGEDGHTYPAVATKIVETVETILPWRSADVAVPLRSLVLPGLNFGEPGFHLEGWGHSPGFVIDAIDRALRADHEQREPRQKVVRRSSEIGGGSRHTAAGYQIPRLSGPTPIDPAVPPSVGRAGRVSTSVNPQQQYTGGQHV